MEVWWVSPALVAVGVVITIVLSARRDAKHSGVVDTLLQEHHRRLTAHGEEIDNLKDEMGDQIQRITRVEVRCQTLHCDTLHAKVIAHD